MVEFVYRRTKLYGMLAGLNIQILGHNCDRLNMQIKKNVLYSILDIRI